MAITDTSYGGSCASVEQTYYDYTGVGSTGSGCSGAAFDVSAENFLSSCPTVSDDFGERSAASGERPSPRGVWAYPFSKPFVAASVLVPKLE